MCISAVFSKLESFVQVIILTVSGVPFQAISVFAHNFQAIFTYMFTYMLFPALGEKLAIAILVDLADGIQ